MLHALFSDLARGFSHEGVHLTAAEWKMIICSYFAFALAEADGLPPPTMPLPESTSKMDVERMNNCIEYVIFLAVHLGVELSE